MLLEEREAGWQGYRNRSWLIEEEGTGQVEFGEEVRIPQSAPEDAFW